MIRAGRHSRGFTLIETLVALAIAAMVMNGFYQALSTGSLLDRRADQQAGKVFVAINILDQVGVDIPLRLGTLQTGSTRGLDWELVISGVPAADQRIGAIYPNELIFVSVSVVDPNDQGADPVVLRTIRYSETPL